MTKLYRIIVTLYVRGTNSIAFLPAIIAISFFIFSLSILFFDRAGYGEHIKELIPRIIAHETESARQLLSTLTGGIISLTVFSFSMVMIVINQASSSFSPRVIPGLLSKKPHQIVLGFYIGTIIYTTVLLGSLGGENTSPEVLGLAVLFSIFFAITCLVLFIYFIHSISKAIQVDNIIKAIFTTTLRQIKKNNCVNNDHEYSISDTAQWHVITSSSEGYLQSINYAFLTRLARDNDIIIELLVPKGVFLLRNYPLCKTNRDISNNKTLRTTLLDCFFTYTDEYIEENYIYGFKQISEIAVKALSPGINDPGTALHAIDLLTILYLNKMEMHENQFIADADGQLRIINKLISFDELLYRYLSPIREYGKSDVFVVARLLECLKRLLYADIHGKYTASLTHHAKIILDDTTETLMNPFDRSKINESIADINSLAIGRSSLPYLS